MAYHTGIYLLLFLPAVLLLYQLTPKKSRWITLLAAGYLFFWICSGKLVLYLLGTTLFTHYIAVWISWIKTKCNDETAGMQRTEAGTIKKAYKKKEKAILVFGICVLLGILAYLKYYNFFIQNVNVLLAQGGSSLALGTKQMLIPVGISFYTLQAIGYMADVYWEKVEVFRHPGKIALFLGFFPQIMEGPISSYAQTADTLFEGNPLTMENLAQGSVRIFWGLFKKLLIADRLYLLVDVIFNNYQYHYGEMIVIVAIAYTTQLYMEFSGCMDIIIGSGKMFGVTLPENFRQPFFSKSAAEFWRRWHITLGRWFREYVYIPLGGNRKGKARTIFNLFVVWSLTAVWHGAEGHFLIWGASLLLLLALEKAFLLQFLKKSEILSHVYLVLVVPLTWMAFAIADVGQLGVYYARMFPFFGVGETVRQMDFLQYLKDYGPLFLMGIVFSTPYPTALYKVFEKKWLGSLAVIVVLGLSLYYMAVSTNNPFLYFNF